MDEGKKGAEAVAAPIEASVAHDVRVISVLRTTGARLPRTELRIVSWNKKEPTVERRVFIQDRATGQERGGKCRGLTYKDICHIVANWPSIQSLMKEWNA